MKKITELIEDIRTDLNILTTSTDISELDRASARLTHNAKEFKKRADRRDNNHIAFINKLEKFGF